MSYKYLASKWAEDPAYYIQTEDRIALGGKIILRRAGRYILINKDINKSPASFLKDRIGAHYRRKLLYIGKDCMELEPEEALLRTQWNNSYRDRVFISLNYEILPHVMKDIYIRSKVYPAKRRRLLGSIRGDHYVYPDSRSIQVVIFIPRARLLITSNREHTVEEGYTILYCQKRPSHSNRDLLGMIAEAYASLEDKKMQDKLVRGMELDSENMLTFMELVSEIKCIGRREKFCRKSR